MRRASRSLVWQWVAAVGLLAWATPSWAAKVDTITLVNGDVITCEIKELQRGKVRVKTDSIGTIYVEWDDIVQMTSPRFFKTQVHDGSVYYGNFEAASEPYRLLMVFGEDRNEIDMEQVTNILPIAKSFWGKVDGSLTLGMTYTKASDVLQWNLSWETTYRSRKHILNFSVGSVITVQTGEETTERNEVSFSYTRQTDSRLFGWVNGGFQQNTELGVAHRFLVTAAPGYMLLDTGHSNGPALVGLSVNYELPTGDGDWNTSLEATIGGGYSLYFYNFPKTNIDFSIYAYPSLTISKRFRTDINFKLKRELIRDFIWDFQIWYSYDNTPPDPTAAHNDYGIVTSLGWTY